MSLNLNKQLLKWPPGSNLHLERAMNANDRRSKRHHISLHTRLITPDGRQRLAALSNISLDGAYLSPSLQPVPMHSLVKLCLDIEDKGYLIQAMVVHNNEHGTGLMFRQAEPKLYLSATQLDTTPNTQPPKFVLQFA